AQLPLAAHSVAGRAFLAAYRGGAFREPAGPYGLAAYASMQALLRAGLNSNHTRPSVTGALKRGRFETALGPVRFDQWGQALGPVIPIYRVEQGRWTPVRLVADEQVKPWSEQ